MTITSATHRIIYFDLETTGLREPGNEPHIVEISAYDPERNEYFTRFVNPEMPIPPIATNIHGITDDMVQTAYKVNEMLAEFIPWAEKPLNGSKPKVILVGYNSDNYDFPIMHAEGARSGVGVPSDWSSFDIFKLVNILRIKSEPNRKLQTLRQNFGIPMTEAHRAQGDTEVTFQLALKLFNNANVKDIHNEMSTSDLDPYLPIAAMINAAGGPSKFASGEESVKPPEVVELFLFHVNN